MFRGLRGNSPIYIVYKNEPRLAIGEVTNAVINPPQFTAANYVNGVLTPPSESVDLYVKVGNEEITLQKLPTDVSIADFGNMIVSESRDSITSEIDRLRAVSVKAVAEVDRHKAAITEYDRMLESLNPYLAKVTEQAKEIDQLKRMVEALTQAKDTKSKED